jgi:hypothetical protein
MMSRLALIFLFVQFSVIVAHATRNIESHQDSVIRASLNQIETKYNIRIHIYHHGDTSLRNEKNIKGDSVARGGYSFKTISPYQSMLIERFTNVLLAEFNKYPVDFITNSGLKEIAFVANLRVGRQRRIAMPESDTRTLYFDVNYPGARDEYCSHAIHHELFHLLYFEIHGSFYYKDPAWLALNYPSFRYKGGGGLAYGNYHVFKKQKPASGFITPYATYGLEEDMAEVFAFLMTREGFAIITYWMPADEILFNKAQYILRLISSRSPEFNLNYLKRIHTND